MTGAAELRSGKTHRDENFPVASRLVAARHRPAIMAFYNFVRSADDIADHPELAADRKLALLDGLEASLLGGSDAEPEGVALRTALAERGLGPEHAQDLLTAFRRDVTQLRYRDWDDLIDYCRYSAMPVGRFVLDVHGESRATWPASDATCAALQIINHLQDCGADYRRLDRVYVPLDALAAAGAAVEELGAAQASPALKACIAGLAARTAALLAEGAPLPSMVRDPRVALEIAVIQRLARRLVGMLQRRDPLSERVHLGPAGVAAFTALGLVEGAAGRCLRPRRGNASPAARGPNAGESAAARAAGSSFYSAMRILPRERRQAMFEIYAFCRAVDDIADDPGDRAARLEALRQWRRDIDAICGGEAPARHRGLAKAVRAFGLAREDFLAVVDGMEMDVLADICAPDAATLDLYCDRVASAVGRLSVRVFGMQHDDGLRLAYHLGRALQITNILRDLDEDAAIGRLYLPREALKKAGIVAREPREVLADPRIGAVCAELAGRAAVHFRAADEVMDRSPRSAVKAPRMMAEAYRAILAGLERRGFAPPRPRVRLPKSRLLLIVLRHAWP